MTRVTSAMWASEALLCVSLENSTKASVRSSSRRSSRWSLRSVYSRTRSGTSTFLPLTMVRIRLLPGRRVWPPSIDPGVRAPARASPLPGHGDRRHAHGAGRLEGAGGGRERGAGRHDVIHEEDPLPLDPPGALGTGREGPGDVRGTMAP